MAPNKGEQAKTYVHLIINARPRKKRKRRKQRKQIFRRPFQARQFSKSHTVLWTFPARAWNSAGFESPEPLHFLQPLLVSYRPRFLAI